MKKLFLTIALFFVLSCLIPYQCAQAQGQKGKVSVGGNIDGSVGNGFTYLQLSPVVGYWLTEKVNIGAGPVIEHSRYSGASVTNIGGRGYARYYPFQQLFAHAEIGAVNFKNSDGKRRFATRLPIGAGYNPRVGGARLDFMVLYDVLYALNKDNSYLTYGLLGGDYTYGGFIFRVGATFDI